MGFGFCRNFSTIPPPPLVQGWSSLCWCSAVKEAWKTFYSGLFSTLSVLTIILAFVMSSVEHIQAVYSPKPCFFMFPFHIHVLHSRLFHSYALYWASTIHVEQLKGVDFDSSLFVFRALARDGVERECAQASREEEVRQRRSFNIYTRERRVSDQNIALFNWILANPSRKS